MRHFILSDINSPLDQVTAIPFLRDEETPFLADALVTTDDINSCVHHCRAFLRV